MVITKTDPTSSTGVARRHRRAQTLADGGGPFVTLTGVYMVEVPQASMRAWSLASAHRASACSASRSGTTASYPSSMELYGHVLSAQL
jgi:hypothetical protein